MPPPTAGLSAALFAAKNPTAAVISRCSDCDWPQGAVKRSAQPTDAITRLVCKHLLAWLRMTPFTKHPPLLSANAIFEYYSGRYPLAVNAADFQASLYSVVITVDGCLANTWFMIQRGSWTAVVLDDHSLARNGCLYMTYVELDTRSSYDLPETNHGFFSWLGGVQHISVDFYVGEAKMGALCSSQDAVSSIMGTLHVPLRSDESTLVLAMLRSCFYEWFGGPLAQNLCQIMLSFVTGPYITPECCVVSQHGSWFDAARLECPKHWKQRFASASEEFDRYMWRKRLEAFQQQSKKDDDPDMWMNLLFLSPTS